MSLDNKLGFFRDCLDAETRAQVVWNFPSAKSEHVSLLDGDMTAVSVSDKTFTKLQKTLKAYAREKRLLLSVFFLQGRFRVPTFGGRFRAKDIQCPIFHFPCKLDDGRFSVRQGVSVDFTQGIINPAVIQILESFSLEANDFLPPILKEIKGRSRVTELEHLTQKLSGVLLEKSSSQMRLIESRYLSIERKQSNAQGSLYEVEALMQTRHASAPLMAILKEGAEVTSPSSWRRFFSWWRLTKSAMPLPEVLSSAQSKVLESASHYPLSVVSGPPGTGKSFTIACMALNEFSKGRSVLVVSQNQHAVDVVRRKLIDNMGIEPGMTVLGSEQGVSPDVKAQIKSMLGYYNDQGSLDVRKFRKRLNRLTNQVRDRETDFEKHVDGLLLSEPESMKRRFWSFGNRRDDTSELLFEKFLQIENLDAEIKKVVVRLMAARYRQTAVKLANNKGSRKSLEAFAKSLTARNWQYQEKYYSQVDFDDVLQAIPFWFCSVGNLSRFLPLDKELFDLVIIDEATQCNMSVCLPALQRAKRAVIVGDPKQLKHVSFVSYDFQQTQAELHGVDSAEISINFRGNSVIDYAQSACEHADQSTTLDEHFRSHPQIIGFSNKEFYGDSLKVMTERPSNRKRSVELIQTQGKRLTKGVNKLEAADLFTKVREVIKQQRNLPETQVHTIGVLAFFSAQASYLEKMIFDRTSLNNLRRHNIRVGTPFSFQGEERDHMLISCSVDANTSGSAYVYLNRDDVFNVAITRARDYQTLFLSCDPKDLKPGSKLQAYIKYLSEYEYSRQSDKGSIYDSFQNEICNWLNKRGVDTFKNYMVAGISIDIMAVFHGHALAIDLIGFEGKLKFALSLNQFKLLQRAGLESFLLPYQEWKDYTETVLHALMIRLGAAHELPDSSAQIDKFSDQRELAFAAITNGVSINQLNARLLRNEEFMACEQLVGLVDRYERFTELLRENFIPEELTYKRYLNALHELIEYCLNNLKSASVAAELANTMFREQRELYGDAKFDNSFDDVIAARLDMVDQQRAKFKSLLNENRDAFLQIDDTMIKLSNLNASDHPVDPKRAFEELSARLELYRGKTLTDKR